MRYFPNIKPMLDQQYVFFIWDMTLLVTTVTMRKLIQWHRNGELMLGQRRRRWANINPTLIQRFVLTGKSAV